MSKIDDNMAHLKDLRAKLDAKHIELERSLAIIKLCPDAFEHGRVHSHVRGTPHKPKEMEWVLKKGNGELVVFPLLDVPESLWGTFTRKHARSVTHGRVSEWMKLTDEERNYITFVNNPGTVQ